MRILITGGTGLLGKALIEMNKDAHRIWTVYLGNYDVPNNKQTNYYKTDVCKINDLEIIFFEARPEFVIHTAAIANVDYCEKNYEEAWYSNFIGTRNVIELCKKYDSRIVYISTNAVFDGKKAPYSEDDPPCPINNYGKIKLECEENIKNSNLRYLLVRPILMYGWNNKNERLNPVTWLLNKLQNREKVNMVTDVYENPLLNHHCAEIIWTLVRLNKEGLYHIGGRDVVNRYEFAKLIAEVFELKSEDLIFPVTSDFFPDIAPRPKNTSYDTEKLSKELNIKPLGLKDGLLYMKRTRSEYEEDYCQQ